MIHIIRQNKNHTSCLFFILTGRYAVCHPFTTFHCFHSLFASYKHLSSSGTFPHSQHGESMKRLTGGLMMIEIFIGIISSYFSVILVNMKHLCRDQCRSQVAGGAPDIAHLNRPASCQICFKLPPLVYVENSQVYPVQQKGSFLLSC